MTINKLARLLFQHIFSVLWVSGIGKIVFEQPIKANSAGFSHLIDQIASFSLEKSKDHSKGHRNTQKNKKTSDTRHMVNATENII